jgi:hypothetical protein
VVRGAAFGSAFVLLLLLAGCGNDDGTAGTADKKAKAAYVAKGNAVCDRAEVRLAKATSRLQSRADHGKPDPSTSVISSTLPPSGPEALDGLHRPSPLQAELEEVFSPAQKVEAMARNSKNPGVMFSPRARELLSDEARNLSNYGLDDCAAAYSRSIAAMLGAEAGEPVVGGSGS